jgi:SAM-dependent methyltransferase
VNSKEHWEGVYSAKSDSQVSWTQQDPRLSLALIRQVCPPGGRIIDVGGGTSLLVDRLLEEHYRVSVLDISASAINRARARLGPAASKADWIVADLTLVESPGTFDLWHDRAVFHFLTDAADRRKYIALLEAALPQHGHAIIATFAPDGPERCSGLEVCRYDGQSLARELGSAFELIRTVPETHQTPWGKPQSFQYSVFRKK